MTKAPERVGISEASLIAGIPKRTLQAFAASGGIPGAGKPAGRWTFDVEELRRWARKVNRKAPGGVEFNVSRQDDAAAGAEHVENAAHEAANEVKGG